MKNTPSTSPALDELGGAEIADSLYERKLAEANTIGDVRRDLQNLLSEVGSEGAVGGRMQEIAESVDHATESGAHDNIAVEDDLGPNVLGLNKMGSKESMLRRDQLSSGQITERTDETKDTILHENSDEVGHAGQDPSAVSKLGVVTEDGKIHSPTTIIEGDVVSGVSQHLGQRREGLPEETYLEGADLVEEIGADKVKSYVRKGGANVGKNLQTEIWRMQPSITLEQMRAQGAAVGMSEADVLAIAKEQGKVPEGQEVPVALAV